MRILAILLLSWCKTSVQPIPSMPGIYRVHFKNVLGAKRSILTDDTTININRL